jgi:hypothetical protein
MKVIKFLTISSAVLAILCLNSCVNVDEAEKYANNFYEAMQAKEYQKLENLIDETMLASNSMEEIRAMIVQKESLGEMVSFQKETGHDYRESNGLTVVRFLYTVKYTDIMLYEYIRLTKRGDAYKVVNYGYYNDKEKRQEFIEHVEG